MANVLDILKPLAQPPHSGFDLSSKHVYGGAPGRVDSPVQIETLPGDMFKINIGALMRTMTPDTAPFLRGKITYDFFFVPFSQIWHPFNQFVDQRKDVHSARQRGSKFVPVINLGKLLKFIYYCAVGLLADGSSMDDYRDVEGVSWYANIWHMLDFFGYGNFLWLKSEFEDTTRHEEDIDDLIEPYMDKYVNIFRPAAYQHAWYDVYRNKFYDNYEYDPEGYAPDYVLCFNFDDIECSSFATSIIDIDVTSSTFAQMCENNVRIIMLFTQRYCQYKQDVFQSALPSQQFGVVSTVDLNLSGVTTINGSAILNGSTGTDSDRWQNASGGDIPNSAVVVTASSRNTIASQSPNQVLYHTHSVSGTANLQTSGTFTGTSSFDVITLKRSEALQKWRQNAMRAGNMVDDSFRAHWGVTPRYESDNNVLKLGSFEGSLNVDTVQATAQYDGIGNNKVGSLGASMSAVISGNDIDFKCSDYGVIVCMQYFRPESEYASAMIDRANTLYEPFDFPIPEFCNTGLSPIMISDINHNDLPGVQGILLGFASQYWWCKQAFDKCHGQFAKYYVHDSLGFRYVFKGDSVMWNAPRMLELTNQGQSDFYRSKSNLYVDPNIINDICDVVYADISSSDPMKVVDNLIFNTYFKVGVLRQLTDVGLPNF